MLDQSVAADLKSVLERFYPDLEDQAKCMVEFQQYKSKSIDAFKPQVVWMQAKLLSPAAFWEMHGAATPLLRTVALCVLNLNHAAGGCERNWSCHDFLYSKRRASTSATTLSNEVYYYTNSRMFDSKLARGSKRPKKKRRHCDNDGQDVSYPEWGVFCIHELNVNNVNNVNEYSIRKSNT